MVPALIGVLVGAVVGFAACTGDSLCHDDEGVAYRTGSVVVAGMAGLISGVVHAALVRQLQRRAAP